MRTQLKQERAYVKHISVCTYIYGSSLNWDCPFALIIRKKSLQGHMTKWDCEMILNEINREFREKILIWWEKREKQNQRKRF